MDKKPIDPNYRKMIPEFKKAKFCSFLILPFQFEEDGLNKEWERQYMKPFTISSSDLNGIVESMMNEDGTISIGRCWRISKDVLIKKMSAGKVSVDTHSFYVEKEQCNGWFDFEDSYLFEFHTNIAFLVLTITYKKLETIAYITDKGYARERSQFYYIEGQDKHFLSIQNWISNLVVAIGLKSFFLKQENPFLESFVCTLGIVPERFATTEVLRQTTFNLHKMTPLENPEDDTSEEDIRFVYSVIDSKLNSYRWGVCVSSQSISYITANATMNCDAEIKDYVTNSLPIVILALYEKYSCLHFTEMLATTDLKHLKQLQNMKNVMLEFQAYGTLAPANLSRWHNIRTIYSNLLEVNNVSAAIQDIDHKTKILSEHQKTLESKRIEKVTFLITVFGIVSILASVLSIVQTFQDGNCTTWFFLILTVLVIAICFTITMFLNRE